jgi:hypothetical protein
VEGTEGIEHERVDARSERAFEVGGLLPVARHAAPGGVGLRQFDAAGGAEDLLQVGGIEGADPRRAISSVRSTKRMMMQDSIMLLCIILGSAGAESS